MTADRLTCNCHRKDQVGRSATSSTIAAMHGVIATIRVTRIAGVALWLKRLIAAAARLAAPGARSIVLVTVPLLLMRRCGE
jgi:hypothetical protein